LKFFWIISYIQEFFELYRIFKNFLNYIVYSRIFELYRIFIYFFQKMGSNDLAKKWDPMILLAADFYIQNIVAYWIHAKSLFYAKYLLTKFSRKFGAILFSIFDAKFTCVKIYCWHKHKFPLWYALKIVELFFHISG